MAWEVGQKVYHCSSYRTVGEVAVVEKVYRTGHAVVDGRRFNENGRATGDWPGYASRPFIEALTQAHLDKIEQHKLYSKAMRCLEVLQKGLSVQNVNLAAVTALLTQAVDAAVDPRAVNEGAPQ